MRFGAHGPAEGEPIDGAQASAPARNQAGNSEAPENPTFPPGSARRPRGAEDFIARAHSAYAKAPPRVGPIPQEAARARPLDRRRSGGGAGGGAFPARATRRRPRAAELPAARTRAMDVGSRVGKTVAGAHGPSELRPLGPRRPPHARAGSSILRTPSVPSRPEVGGRCLGYGGASRLPSVSRDAQSAARDPSRKVPGALRSKTRRAGLQLGDDLPPARTPASRTPAKTCAAVARARVVHTDRHRV